VLRPPAPGMKEFPFIDPKRPRDKRKRRNGEIEPIRPAEDGGGVGQSRDRKPVPIGQELVVDARPNARCARGEELRPIAGERRFDFGRGLRQMIEAVEDIVPFPVSGGGDIVEFLEARRALAQDGIDFRGAPNLELAFFVLAVGIEARGETALGQAHFTGEPSDGLGDALGVKRVLGVPPRGAHKIDQ
jgi:hypothetical protein